ncbi:uncharacterized protein LOC143163502 isoform X2 [Aptenodytes patagonicus]|uniref:uncharacterized protein LOC143163502 isoform X2 n=1 Tax=Aptenodytes patagonicus TaxID=9234 RepID=UPI003F9EF39D
MNRDERLLSKRTVPPCPLISRSPVQPKHSFKAPVTPKLRVPNDARRNCLYLQERRTMALGDESPPPAPEAEQESMCASPSGPLAFFITGGKHRINWISMTEVSVEEEGDVTRNA